MANVQFKRGSQQSLETLLAKQGIAGSYVEGAFYLTTDSDRLYFAQSDKELVHLNHNVIHVAQIKDLPALADAVVGDFYYCIAENVLCTKKAGGTEWVQINKNTDNDHDTSVTGMTASVSVNDSNNTLTLSYAIQQTLKNLLNNSSETVEDVIASVTLSKTDLDKILDLATNVTASVSGGIATITTNGNGSGGNGFTIKGAGSVSVGGNPDDIIIAGTNTTYDISKDINSENIVLKGSDNKTSSIAFAAGTDLETINTTANTIAYKHANVTHVQETPAQVSVSHGSTFTTISDITVSDTGHVIGSIKQVYTLPDDKYAKSLAVDRTGTNGNIAITMADNSTIVDNGTLFYKIENIDGTEHTFYNGAVLNVYSKEDIDNKFLGINAMTYKGVAGTIALPSSGVHIGDTYMVDKAGTLGGHTCEIGDLLIATGDEDIDGIIASGTLVWTIVPAGNDIDSQFALSVASEGKIVLKNTTANKTVGTVIIEGDAINGDIASNEIIVTTDSTNGKIKIAHAAHTTSELNDNLEASSNLTHGGFFNALTEITADDGHITGYKTQKFKLPDDNNTTYNIEVGGSNDATTIVLTGSNKSSDSIVLAGGAHINTSVGNNQINIDHDVIQVDKKDNTGTVTPLTHGGTFDVITTLESSDGHVDGFTINRMQLPADNNTTNQTLTQFTTVAEGVAVIQTDLKDSANKTLTALTTIKSNSLAVNPYNTNEGFSIDLEWGNF